MCASEPSWPVISVDIGMSLSALDLLMQSILTENIENDAATVDVLAPRVLMRKLNVPIQSLLLKGILRNRPSRR